MGHYARSIGGHRYTQLTVMDMKSKYNMGVRMRKKSDSEAAFFFKTVMSDCQARSGNTNHQNRW